MASDENYIFFGTRFYEKGAFFELNRGLEKVERGIPIWEQTVTDKEGRQRFHGAFTGGFSAGFYNTVGSKEGFAPKSYKTSRTSRSKMHQQSIEDFMDIDELDEQKKKLKTHEEYDTFSTRMSKKTESYYKLPKNEKNISETVIRQVFAPVADSFGIRLLQKMGWRQGKGIGENFHIKRFISNKWGPDASISPVNNLIFKSKGKNNFHGLGYSSFKSENAIKNLDDGKLKSNISKLGKGVAFGTGALEDSDTFGEMEDYVECLHEDFKYDIESEKSDSDNEENKIKYIKNKQNKDGKILDEDSFIPGFKMAVIILKKDEIILPKIPESYIPFQKSRKRMKTENEDASPRFPHINIPKNSDSKHVIDTLAVFVARNGEDFENIAKERNRNNKQFSFLFGGDGYDYYRWKIIEFKKMYKKFNLKNIFQRNVPLTTDERSTILGEKLLVPSNDSNLFQNDRWKHMQQNLTNNFIKGENQEYFDPKSLIGGLRECVTNSKNDIHGDSKEYEEEEEMHVNMNVNAKVNPLRYFEEWNPECLLCKRFNLPDPNPEMKITSHKIINNSSTEIGSINQPNKLFTNNEGENNEENYQIKYYERPIDLFSAIFEISDSSTDNEKIDSPDTKMPHDSFKISHNRSSSQKIGLKKNDEDDKLLSNQNKIPFMMNDDEKTVSKKRKSKSTEITSEIDICEASHIMSTMELEELLKKIKKYRKTMNKKHK